MKEQKTVNTVRVKGNANKIIINGFALEKGAHVRDLDAVVSTTNTTKPVNHVYSNTY